MECQGRTSAKFAKKTKLGQYHPGTWTPPGDLLYEALPNTMNEIGVGGL